jgi:hypothetical protein
MMPTQQTGDAQRGTKTLDEDIRLQRRRDRGDVVIIIESLLALLVIVAGAAFFAWSVSEDNVQVANTATHAAGPAY